MQPQSDSDYKKIFTELIKKQMIVLGPDITIAKAKNVKGVEVNEKGEVTNINGDPQVILQTLINQFVELSGTIVKKTMESILNTYPGMAGMAANSMTQNLSTQPQQVKPENQPQNNLSNQQSTMGANPFSDPFSQNQQQNTQNQTAQSSQNVNSNQNGNTQQFANQTSNQTSNQESNPAPVQSPNSENASQLPKEEMDSINQALSELQKQQPNTQSNASVENSSSNVQQSNNNN